MAKKKIPLDAALWDGIAEAVEPTLTPVTPPAAPKLTMAKPTGKPKSIKEKGAQRRIYLNDDEYWRLKKHGNGSLTVGVRKLMQTAGI